MSVDEALRLRPTSSLPSMTSSGRRLVVAMVVLLICDVIGGFIGVATGAETWGTAWGFDTHSTVPLPMGAAQLVLAWLAARDVRPRVGFVAAVLLSAICLMSVLFGLFDGDLIGNVIGRVRLLGGRLGGAPAVRHRRGWWARFRSGQAAPPATLTARRRSSRSGVGPRLCNLDAAGPSPDGTPASFWALRAVDSRRYAAPLTGTPTRHCDAPAPALSVREVLQPPRYRARSAG